MQDKFCLTVDYSKDEPNPEMVFLGISKLISAFSSMDNDLSGCIDSKIEPVIILEDVERGSIKVWLKNIVKSLPDEGLKDGDIKKIIGAYLLKAKYIILTYVGDKETISSIEDVQNIENNIFNLAKQTDVSMLGCYTCPVRSNLLNDISNYGEALSNFREKDNIYFETPGGNKLHINSGFRLPRENIERFCTGETIENIIEAILKVKQPDFLGNAQWSFKYGKQTIEAKILDEEWLFKYKHREITVLPGDSLKVKIRTETVYGKNNDILNQKNSIIEVLAVVAETSNDYSKEEVFIQKTFN